MTKTLFKPRLSAAAVAMVTSFGLHAATMEEVVVTAQKRAQNATDVPISIAAFDGEKLANAGLDSVNDLQVMVPGLRVDQQGTFSQPTIRGVGSSTAGAGMTSNVAVYIDGFYVPSQLGTDMQLLNLANVQVLKGPQGTLFGRNATGGAILLNTRDASVEPTLQLEATAARFDKRELKLYASSGITDNLAVDISGIYSTGDGFLEDMVTGADDVAQYDRQTYRGSLRYEATENFSAELALAYSKVDDPFHNAKGAWDGHTLGRLVDPANALVADRYGKVSNTAPLGFEYESEGAFLTLKWALGDMDLTSYTMAREEESLSQLDSDASNIPVWAVQYDTENETFSQEFNLTGSHGRLDWVVGAYFMKYEEKYHDLQATETVMRVYSSIGNDIESRAVFADGTYALTDRLFLTLGLRYSEEEADAFIQGHMSMADVKWDADWNSTTPRAVLRYALTEQSNVYVSYAQGFKAGLLNPSGNDTTPVDEEVIDAWEIGYKYQDDRNRFEAAAYTYSYDDMQVASHTGVVALIVNAGESSIKGLDLDYTRMLTDRLEVSIAGSWVDAEYDKFPGSQLRDLDPASPTYLGILPSSAEGRQMMRSPKLTGTLGVQYDAPVPVGRLQLNGNLYYTDKFYFDPNEQFRQDAYTLVNLRATWFSPSERFSLALFANNVTDEEYLVQVAPGSQAVGQSYGEPRVFGATVGYKY